MKKTKVKKEKTAKSPKVKKKHSVKNGILIFLISCGILVASSVLAFALYIIITSPDFIPNELYNKEATIIYAKDGTTELARYGNENVELITYNDLPQVLIDALVATEDSRYFQHNGFDAARFLKASLGQLAGQNAGGASTLSMQVIKNKFQKKKDGTVESSGIKGIIRKFSDIYMAVFKLEAVYTKEEIIEFYLNSQWLGGGSINYGSITGVEQGSQYFFGKSVSDLSLPEASLLVGIFNNPSYFSPYSNPEGATSRRSTVLNLMVRHGYISEEEKEFAESVSVESLLIDHSESSSNSKYQAFIDYVIWQVKKETGDDPYKVPMAIYTTLDPAVQDVLYQLETGELYKFKDEKIQEGIAITNTEDGSIVGLSGGRNYKAQGLNRAVGKYNYDSQKGIGRQPGSTAKPIFDYGPYIEYLHGSTGTIFIDKPWTYTNGPSVVNFDRSYHGAVTMRSALVQSLNVPAVQAFQQVAKEAGKDKIAEFVHNLGINYGDDLYESYAIGGGFGTDPLSMSAAYAAFGRGGYYIEPYAFTKIRYLENDYEYPHKVEKTRVMSEETAYMITDMLISGNESGVGGFTISGTDIAAKGGTTTIDAASAKANGIPSDATPDHWNITYSPDYCIALWHGYDNHKEGYFKSSQGGQYRRAIMKAVATRVYKKNSKFTNKPSGVTSMTVERETYPTMLPSSNTPNNLKLTELFLSGYEPSETSPRFETLRNPTNGKYATNGPSITISWDAIPTPTAIDPSHIEEMFNDPYWEFYEKYKTQYYQSRIDYNTNNIGIVGYQVYLVSPNSPDSLISLGFTTNTSFTYTPPTSSYNYTFIVKSAYSIYKDNQSEGLEINVKTGTNIGSIGGPVIPDDDDDDDNSGYGALD